MGRAGKPPKGSVKLGVSMAAARQHFDRERKRNGLLKRHMLRRQVARRNAHHVATINRIDRCGQASKCVHMLRMLRGSSSIGGYRAAHSPGKGPSAVLAMFSGSIPWEAAQVRKKTM